MDDIIPTENKSRIIIWGMVMALFSVGAWIMNVVANRMASRTSSLTIQNIRQDLFERSMGLSARQIDNISVSSLESRMTSDTYVIHRFLGATLRMGIRSVMLFLGGVVLLLSELASSTNSCGLSCSLLIVIRYVSVE